MAFLLRRQLLRPLIATAGASSSIFLISNASRSRGPLRCESRSAGLGDAFNPIEKDTKVPIFKNGKLNPAAYKQLSSGSIMGLVAGLAVSSFSRSLTFVFGLAVFGVQFLASRGFDIIPVKSIQRYVQSVNLRSAIEDNVAFKLSFGATFMLAAFAQF